MDSVALWMENEDERMERRILRDGVDFMQLTDAMFVRNFRLNYVLESIRSQLLTTQRSTGVTPEIKLGVTLKFLGQGGYQQHQIGQDHFAGLAQQTVLCHVRNSRDNRSC
ncbi:uncharacterized protein LOC142225560 [Haematobia irritans]|uniref:uncharacterized protein LOC142225560 n=1 Tax=Haematobia irritans TaxID=7368 RepID=UPI003F4F94F3